MTNKNDNYDQEAEGAKTQIPTAPADNEKINVVTPPLSSIPSLDDKKEKKEPSVVTADSSSMQ